MPGSRCMVVVAIGSLWVSVAACGGRTNDSLCGDDPDCDDGISCTEDFCRDGMCVYNELADRCDDDNPCTDDACVQQQGGCVHEPNTAACDDGNPCTHDDRCQSGQCYGGGNSCTCDTDADCQPYDDGDLCNGILRCSDGACEIDPDTVIACDHAADTDCLRNTCDPATGTCSLVPAPDGHPCDDGDSCTDRDVCIDGVCTGNATACDDGNPCTDDSCDAQGGCIHTNNQAPCDDGNQCTRDDACRDGACRPGAPLDCSDDNPCTDDVCEPANGCVFPYNDDPCDDGDPSTSGDACIDGFCVGDSDLYADVDDLSGEALRQALLGLVDGHSSISYDAAREEIFSDLDNVGGKVECAYTGTWVTTSGIPDSDVMNTEHTWCRSWGSDSMPALSDLHHLYPVLMEANSVRSYLSFGDVLEPDWSMGGSSRGIDAREEKVFEVRPAHRGDTARSMFYFAVRYQMEIYYTQEQTLRAWHHQDPPDNRERQRNDGIESIQHNRNPFVDRPDFVDRIGDF